jgi:hypothetical protein
MPVAVSGLQQEGTATNQALRRLTEFVGSRGATGRVLPSSGTGTAATTGPKSSGSGFSTNVAKVVGLVKGAYVTPPIGTTGGFTGIANGGGIARGQYKGLVDLEEDDEEIDLEFKEGDVTKSEKTEFGTPVASAPSHCIWVFSDKNLREHVGISVVLPSSVGLNSKQLKNKVSDDGQSLTVKMFHPPSWSKTTFHKKACYNEGLSKEFTGYLINSERAELEKLARLAGSDSRDKIATFMVIKLPIVCELEIRYTIPIHHQETSTTTYIFVLRSIRSKDDFLQKEKPKMAHVFNDEDDEDSVDSNESGDGAPKRRRLN